MPLSSPWEASACVDSLTGDRSGTDGCVLGFHVCQAGDSLLKCRPGHCRMLNGVPGLHPPDASGSLSLSSDQKESGSNLWCSQWVIWAWLFCVPASQSHWAQTMCGVSD